MSNILSGTRGQELPQERKPVDEILDQLELSIDDCVAAVEGLRTSPSVEAAEDACLACREAVQLYFFARGDFGERATTRVGMLVDSLKQSNEALDQLVQMHGSDSVFSSYRENVVARRQLLDALLADDVTTIRQMIRERLGRDSHTTMSSIDR